MNFLSVYLTLLIWIAMGAVTAYFARQRGRDPIIWFVVGLLFGIFGFIVLFFMPTAQTAQPVKEEPALSIEASASAISPAEYMQKSWFYLTSEGEQVGPLSFERLKQNWEEKTITAQTYVWCDGMKDWESLAQMRLF